MEAPSTMPAATQISFHTRVFPRHHNRAFLSPRVKWGSRTHHKLNGSFKLWFLQLCPNSFYFYKINPHVKKFYPVAKQESSFCWEAILQRSSLNLTGSFVLGTKSGKWRQWQIHGQFSKDISAEGVAYNISSPILSRPASPFKSALTVMH